MYWVQLLKATCLIFFLQQSCSFNLKIANNKFLRNSIASVVGFLTFSNVPDPIRHSLWPEPVEAAIAPLADVGIREFLVKDGSQLLRLSLPEGRNMLMGKDSIGKDGRVAQEQIELVRLRLEQVGFANNAVWTPALADLNVATSLLEKRVRIQ